MRVLFVCAGNSCRSPMAAALARARGIEADSAGTGCDSGVAATANAVAVMEERGLDLRGHRSKNVDEVDLSQFDAVVAMTPAIAAALSSRSPHRMITWAVADPYGGSLERYRAAAVEIERCLSEL